jgi:hypothetical protein
MEESGMTRLRWWGGRVEGGRHSAQPRSAALPWVVRLAGEELRRAAGEQRVGISDWRLATDRFVDLCGNFGVVLSPAADGLDQLVRYVYQPLRDASFLTAKLLEDEVSDHLTLGIPLGPAFRQVTDAWLEDFGLLLVDDLGRPRDPGLPSSRIIRRRPIRSHAYPPYSLAPDRVLLLHAEQSAAGGRSRAAADPTAEYQRSLRMDRRKEGFQAGEVDFTGAGGREVVRVIFVTAMVLRDAVRSRVHKHPTRPFGASYREVLDRYRAITAKLVVDSFEPV